MTKIVMTDFHFVSWVPEEQDQYVNTMSADAQAPDGARASWAMILTM